MKVKNKLIEILAEDEELNSNDVLELYDALSVREQEKLSYNFEDEIRSRIEDDIRDDVKREFENKLSEKIESELRHEFEFDIIIKVNNLYEQSKMGILKVAFEKYNLDELIEKLDITQLEAL